MDAPARHYFLLSLPKKWGIKRVEKGIFDGQKPDKTNLSDLAFCTDWLGRALNLLIDMHQSRE